MTLCGACAERERETSNKAQAEIDVMLCRVEWIFHSYGPILDMTCR